ncbi:MAG TPA: hypothetical protein VFB67_09085 [Candidatus Polarisedimenticolaceae bacterium]|nr:hypothetical protein [Candidatus Polarisedimenticolaceae bacterium]
MRARPIAVLALPLFLAPRAGDAATVRGFVSIESRKGNSDPSGVVVWLEGGPGPVPPPRRERIETREKTFAPALLVVPPGSTVAFPNGDTIRHNVFSLSEGNPFDLGLYGKGESREASLPRPGIVRVYCNVHPKMAATIVVAPARHVARAAADGAFTMADVAPGRYEIHAWDERGGTTTQAITVGEADAPPVALALDARGYKARPHLDKNGRSYDERDAPPDY